jgi:hypothetical protein
MWGSENVRSSGVPIGRYPFRSHVSRVGPVGPLGPLGPLGPVDVVDVVDELVVEVVEVDGTSELRGVLR